MELQDNSWNDIRFYENDSNLIRNDVEVQEACVPTPEELNPYQFPQVLQNEQNEAPGTSGLDQSNAQDQQVPVATGNAAALITQRRYSQCREDEDDDEEDDEEDDDEETLSASSGFSEIKDFDEEVSEDQEKGSRKDSEESTKVKAMDRSGFEQNYKTDSKPSTSSTSLEVMETESCTEMETQESTSPPPSPTAVMLENKPTKLKKMKLCGGCDKECEICEQHSNFRKDIRVSLDGSKNGTNCLPTILEVPEEEEEEEEEEELDDEEKESKKGFFKNVINQAICCFKGVAACTEHGNLLSTVGGEQICSGINDGASTSSYVSIAGPSTGEEQQFPVENRVSCGKKRKISQTYTDECTNEEMGTDDARIKVCKLSINEDSQICPDTISTESVEEHVKVLDKPNEVGEPESESSDSDY